MTAIVKTFALIGRSFPSETFEGLHQKSVAERAARRIRRTDPISRVWSATKDAIVVPKRLSA